MLQSPVLSSYELIQERFESIRKRSEEIAKPLNKEDFIPQPVHFASPPKWHLAHVTWFFEEFLLKRFRSHYKAYDDEFGFLFNSYYNTIGARTFRADRGVITRPTVEDVMSYRRYVDDQMLLLIQEKGDDTEFLKILEIGINHEQQHQELFITDLKHTFSLNPLFPIYKEEGDLTKDKNTASGWVKIDEGIHEIGHQGEDFCFDNELGRHKVFLHAASLSKELVTNGEYIQFIESGGYSNFEHWLDEGWAWVQEYKISAPLYWHKEKDGWFHYTLGGYQPLDPDAMLTHVSFYEADAFARWQGMRLPTEFEWEVASPQLDWGKRWEWTASAYLPYPGFKTAPGALGEYNGKFMVNQMVLRGASVATAPGHSRCTYRNFFHAHFQWQFSGIRLATSSIDANTEDNVDPKRDIRN